jgi:hypothetical protein
MSIDYADEFGDYAEGLSAQRGAIPARAAIPAEGRRLSFDAL